MLWRVRGCAIRARVSPREIAAATRFLDSPETWVARLGEDRLNEIWGGRPSRSGSPCVPRRERLGPRRLNGWPTLRNGTRRWL
eukprot:381755-Alexandrium_andersonii.AAC.1